jgi:hypothetical protein
MFSSSSVLYVLHVHLKDNASLDVPYLYITVSFHSSWEPIKASPMPLAYHEAASWYRTKFLWRGVRMAFFSHPPSIQNIACWQKLLFVHRIDAQAKESLSSRVQNRTAIPI